MSESTTVRISDTQVQLTSTETIGPRGPRGPQGPPGSGSGGGVSYLSQLTDVDLAGLQDQDLIGWSEIQGKFVPTGFTSEGVTGGATGPQGPQGPAGASGAFTNLSVFNIESYGAVADNTTNCTSAIQSAVNAALAAGGGVVYAPTPATNGVYLLSTVPYAGPHGQYAQVGQMAQQSK